MQSITQCLPQSTMVARPCFVHKALCMCAPQGNCQTLDAFSLSLAEHRRAVEKLIEERRQQFQQQKDQELEERREEERRQAMRHAIIEQERQRLLREHASKLLGYLPKVHVHFCASTAALFCLYALSWRIHMYLFIPSTTTMHGFHNHFWKQDPTLRDEEDVTSHLSHNQCAPMGQIPRVES